MTGPAPTAVVVAGAPVGALDADLNQAGRLEPLASAVAAVVAPHSKERPVSCDHACVYVGVCTSSTREMLLRPVSENGTMRFPVKNCIRNQSVRYCPVGFRPIIIYGNYSYHIW